MNLFGEQVWIGLTRHRDLSASRPPAPPLAELASSWGATLVFFALAVASLMDSACGGVTHTNTSSAVSLIENGRKKSSGGLICGLLDDGVAHIPENYTTFAPPALGGSYRDTLTGCMVTRVATTDAVHGYSLSEPFNSNSTYMFVRSNQGGHLRIIDLTGSVIVPSSKMPTMNGSTFQPLWAVSDPNSFYYGSGGLLKKGTISGLPTCGQSHTCTITSTTVRDFAGIYNGIGVGIGDYDLSEDGDHIAFVAQEAFDTQLIISVWELSTAKEINKYVTKTSDCVERNVTHDTQPACLHRLQIDPLNRPIMDWCCKWPETGRSYWNGSTLTQFLDTNSSTHSDVGKDINGNAILVQVHNAMPNGTGQNDACNGHGGISWLQLDTLTDHCLYAIDYSADHISYRGGPSQPYVLFDSAGGCPGAGYFNNSPSFHAPTTAIPLFQGQCPVEGDVRPEFSIIALVRIDTVGSTIGALGTPKAVLVAQHRSRTNGKYWTQPRSSISRDGRYVAFDSNMAYVNGLGCGLKNPQDCIDVYVVKVQN